MPLSCHMRKYQGLDATIYLVFRCVKSFLFPGRLAELEWLCLTLTRPWLVKRLLIISDLFFSNTATEDATYHALSHAWCEGCKAVCSLKGGGYG